MAPPLKKGAKILVVEGVQQGSQGIVTMVRRIFDEEDQKTRWVVWADALDGGDRIKTRLSWVRELQ